MSNEAANRSAECEFSIREKNNVLMVPARAVKNEKGKKIVQVLVGKTPEPREVQVGMQTDEAIEIVSGLQEGEKVVTATVHPGDDKGGGGKGGPGGNKGGGPGGGAGGGARGPGGLGGGDGRF